MFDVLFLGTGASVPSREKSLSCVAVKQGKTISLFDCGEGSQRQLMISPWSFMKVDNIFITHIHGDHILGLPGLLQTMSISGRNKPLNVYGPKGFRDALISMMNSSDGTVEYELIVNELEGGESLDFGQFTVTAFLTEHNIASVGYLYREADRPGVFDKEKAISLGLSPGAEFSQLQNGKNVKGVSPDQVIGPARPGCSMVYTGDTVPCEGVAAASEGVDLLVHEATYLESEIELSRSHFHSTAKAAAETARDCKVRMLALIHISNRYGDNDGSVSEASAIFENVIAPADLQMISVTPNEIRSV